MKNSENQRKSIEPTLRFPEFVKPWVERELEEIAFRGSGHTPNKSKQEYYNGGIKWVSLADSNKLDKGYIEKTEIEISEAGIRNSSAVLHPEESVLLSRDAGIGKSAVMKYPMAVSQHFIVWQGKKMKLSNWFFYYVLQILKPEFERIAIGSTIKTIGLPYFKKLKVTIPAFPEQQKIASFLTSLDTRIKQLEKKEFLLAQYKKGVKQKIFSQEIRFKIKNASGNLIDPPNWAEKNLGDVLVIGSGRDYKTLESGDVPVYGTGGLMTYVNDFLYDGESVCIGRKGTIDRPLFLIGKFWTVDTLFYTHSFQGTIPKFMFYVFDSIPWKKYNEASGVPSLSKSTIEKIKIKIPEIEEQVQIAAFLSAIDKKIEQVSAQIEKTQTFKKGLLQQMFV